MGLNLKSSRHLYLGLLLPSQGLPKPIHNCHSSALANTPVLPLPSSTPLTCPLGAPLSSPLLSTATPATPHLPCHRNSFPHHSAASATRCLARLSAHLPVPSYELLLRCPCLGALPLSEPPLPHTALSQLSPAANSHSAEGERVMHRKHIPHQRAQHHVQLPSTAARGGSAATAQAPREAADGDAGC